ncbi:leucine-rich repeat-containing protein 74B-like [Ylistrum balloti]|uniref:leucine-rich repeat-containing protein 74B-like n=1 Tax=Ylistrum balloti TaxID=509963 RepID=UPI002905CE48|nr:leucine-rich repeat-containing protein 74B-like [Ylistrum balloti]
MDTMELRQGSVMSDITNKAKTSQRRTSLMMRNNNSTSLAATSVKAQALANKYRLSKTPNKREPQTKVLRIKKLNEMHATGAFDVEEETIEKARIRKQSERTIGQGINLDEFDDFDFDEEEEYYYVENNDEDASQKIYTEACKEFGAKYMKLIYNQLAKETLSLLSVVLRTTDSKAFATALVKNSSIDTLVLENNRIGGRGARYFAEVLTRNLYLTDVKIVENHLGSEGAEAICKALCHNNYVRRLDLSGNGFVEDDALFFKDMLDENHALRELYLGHNGFRERGGEVFADGLATNDFLRVLDLSWNHLRMGGATAIGKALQVNRHLEKLDISWNGFHVRGAITMSKALETNQALSYLDISCNRLTDACITCLLQGLKDNSTLRVLRMAKNPMFPDSAQKILECVQENPNIGLDLIDLGDQSVTEKFYEILSDLTEKRQGFKVKYGVVWKADREVLGKQDDDEDEDDLINEDPLLVLMEYARMENISLVELFIKLDSDKSGSLSREEFLDGLEQVNIPMRRRALNKLIDKMDQDGDGEIDFDELMSAHEEHKEKLKEYLRGDVPLDETEIGRIDKSLRNVMNKRYIMHKF